MSKKLKSVGSVFMAICLAVTMSSTSLFVEFSIASATTANRDVENSTEKDKKDQKILQMNKHKKIKLQMMFQAKKAQVLDGMMLKKQALLSQVKMI